MENRVAKVVRRKDTSVANAYKYNRWIYRVVVCMPEQNGYLNERGVVLVHESDFITYSGGPKDRAARTECEAIAANINAKLEAGFSWDTPDGVFADYCEESGIKV